MTAAAAGREENAQPCRRKGRGEGDDDDEAAYNDGDDNDQGECYGNFCHLTIQEENDGIVGTICYECNETFHGLCFERHRGWCPACSGTIRLPGITAGFSTTAQTFTPAGPAQQPGEPAPTTQQTTDHDLQMTTRLPTDQNQMLCSKYNKGAGPLYHNRDLRRITRRHRFVASNP